MACYPQYWNESVPFPLMQNRLILIKLGTLLWKLFARNIVFRSIDRLFIRFCNSQSLAWSISYQGCGGCGSTKQGPQLTELIGCILIRMSPPVRSTALSAEDQSLEVQGWGLGLTVQGLKPGYRGDSSSPLLSILALFYIIPYTYHVPKLLSSYRTLYVTYITRSPSRGLVSNFLRRNLNMDLHTVVPTD